MGGREYVLVHGMSHGGWAWEALARRLERNGHCGGTDHRILLRFQMGS